MPSPSELRRMADTAEAEAAEAETRAKALEGWPEPEARALKATLERGAVTLRSQAVELRKLADASEGLHIGTQRAIVRDEMQPEEYRSDQTIGRPITSTHPFAKALKKAKGNVSQWAKKHGETRSRVKSWILDGEGGRPIPRKYAEEIERDFAIPATQGPRGTWKNGIKD